MRMGRRFFILLLGIGLSLTASAQNCAELMGTCEYYQCVEQQENCGKKGYYIKFGDHYCRKYQMKEYDYTQKGKEFLHNVRLCLQEELERERIRANELPKCSKIEKFAIATHKHCYREYRFCNLPLSDQWHVKLTAKKEIFDPQFFLFALWLEKSCL